MFRSLLTIPLLTLALLSAQLGALTHGITHTLGEQSQGSDQSLPHDKHCDLCAAYAQIGSAIGSTGVHFVSAEHRTAAHQHHATRYLSYTFAAFAARAPPRLA
jgi:hypothetical protein